MKDGFIAVYNFINENKIDTMEKFVTKLPIFPSHIQRILAHKHEEYKFTKDDMEKLFMYLCRDDEELPRA